MVTLVLINQERVRVSRTGLNTCGYISGGLGIALNSHPKDVLREYRKGILSKDGEFVVGNLWRQEKPKLYIPFSSVVFIEDDGGEW